MRRRTALEFLPQNIPVGIFAGSGWHSSTIFPVRDNFVDVDKPHD
jgi:hypothetical protein